MTRKLNLYTKTHTNKFNNFEFPALSFGTKLGKSTNMTELKIFFVILGIIIGISIHSEKPPEKLQNSQQKLFEDFEKLDTDWNLLKENLDKLVVISEFRRFQAQKIGNFICAECQTD